MLTVNQPKDTSTTRLFMKSCVRHSILPLLTTRLFRFAASWEANTWRPRCTIMTLYGTCAAVTMLNCLTLRAKIIGRPRMKKTKKKMKTTGWILEHLSWILRLWTDLVGWITHQRSSLKTRKRARKGRKSRKCLSPQCGLLEKDFQRQRMYLPACKSQFL